MTLRLAAAAPAIIGLRETRRIAGDYMLTVDDLRAGRAFDDAIARGVFYLDGMRPDNEKGKSFVYTHHLSVRFGSW